MSDIPTEAPIDIDKVYSDHAKHLMAFNEHDPDSYCYKRPDLAARAREDAELSFNALLIRYGVEPQPARTAAVVAEQNFQRDWPGRTAEGISAEIAPRIAAAGALSKEAHSAAVAQIQFDIGSQRYAQLSMSPATTPSMPKAQFIAMEGERKYREQVEQAKATLKPGETLPQGALADRYALETLSNLGRYTAAREAARARMRK